MIGMFKHTQFVLKETHTASILMYKKLARNCAEQWANGLH